MPIRSLASAGVDEWLRMRATLWPDAPLDDLRAETPAYLGADGPRDIAAFVAPRADGRGLEGFIELSLRNIADGCTTSPVGYIEGWYVDGDARRRGIGRALVATGESWAREKGCTEIASDTWLTATDSQRAHAALGYKEVDRVVLFMKRLR